ncbi:hypothetical protein [Pseudomonas capsici]|uniref:hypothetical protein n=1 Tax=Pseudomonas capsici TaxID=2810614 RepID=UPI0021F1ED25|nr:hypothetical protein [Pseudomonas capsici]MCV4343335.1 hypothetical protein [Pseudomonas capsici]
MRILIGAMMAGGLLASLAGCGKPPESKGLADAENRISELKIYQNSPDMTVKSWWEVKDAGLALSSAKCALLADSATEAQHHLKALAGPKISTVIRCPRIDTYDRAIENVQVQSDTRAIVLARVRNVTPPDDGASTSSSEQRIKDVGSEIRYLLERANSSDGWKIMQITEKAGYTNTWEEIGKTSEPSNRIYVNSGLQ